MSDEHKSEDERNAPARRSDLDSNLDADLSLSAPSNDAPVRATVELPRVVLGSSEPGRQAPRERVLPGRVDPRWLIYPAYIACFLGAGLSVNFAIDSHEWAVGPVLVGWTMLYIWQWIYGVAYQYRRPILKYSSGLMILGLAALLAAVCLDRAPAQSVIASGQLVERARVVRLEGAAALTILSGLFIFAHLTVLGRGYRRVKARDTTVKDAD